MKRYGTIWKIRNMCDILNPTALGAKEKPREISFILQYDMGFIWKILR